MNERAQDRGRFGEGERSSGGVGQRAGGGPESGSRVARRGLSEKGDLLFDARRFEHARVDGQAERLFEGPRFESEGLGLRHAVHHQAQHPALAFVRGRSPAVPSQAEPHDPGGFIEAEGHRPQCPSGSVKRRFLAGPISVYRMGGPVSALTEMLHVDLRYCAPYAHISPYDFRCLAAKAGLTEAPGAVVWLRLLPPWICSPPVGGLMRHLCLFAAGTAAALLASGCAGRGDLTGGAGSTGSGTGSTTGVGLSSGAGTGGSGSGSGGSGSGSGTGGSGNGTGTADGGAGTGNDAGPTVTPLPSALSTPDPCTSNAPGPRKLWRLSGPEFAASIHSVFADTAGSAPVATVFSDPTTLGFSIDANSLLVQGLNASQLEDSAEAVAAWAASAGQLKQFATCAATATGAPASTCATQFIQAFGRRAFRATLASSDARITSYSKIFMAGSSNTDGAQAVISAMLQSPYFLYRSELGAQGSGGFTLTPFEVATELAYTLTGNTPDDTLLTAANSVRQRQDFAHLDGRSTGAAPARHHERQQRDRRDGFAMNGWLGLPRLYTTAKDNTVFVLSQTLQDDMATESQDLILEAFNGGGTFGSVLTADHSFVNKDLATYYGLPTTGLTTAFKSVPYAGTGRDPGLLATGTILNGYARPNTDSPTQRGHMIRSRMLCQDISPPPAGLNTTFMPSTAVETTRDHFVNSHSVGICYTCHKLMDWIGFSFENYDGWGRYRTTDNTLPVDDTATIYNDPEGANDNVTGLSGAGSLSAYLAASADVTKCMSRYWTYFAYGSSSWSQDGCTYDAIKLDARSFFSSEKPIIRQNEFGGTFGGPVILPKLYNGKDRTFFYFTYSGFRLHGGLPTPGLVTLPTVQERAGDFSDYPYPLFDPATTKPDGHGGYTRLPFPNNQIPQNRFSAVAQRAIPLIPNPDIAGTYFNNYVDRSNQPSSDNDWSLKFDHVISEKQHISGAYWWVHGNTQINGPVAGVFNPGFRDTPTEAGGWRVSDEYTITPSLVNHAGFGYTPTSPTWSHWTLDPRLGNQTLQIPGIPADSHGYPQLSFTSLYQGLGNSNANGTDPQFFQNWTGVDDLSWVKGPHQLKFGFEYRRREMTLLDRRNEGGTFNFSPLSTSLPNSPDFAIDGNAFASMLLGEVYSASRAVPAPIRHFQDGFWGLYAEDAWKITHRLTVSLGLRYEVPNYAREKDGQISFLNLNTPNPGAAGLPGALVFLGSGSGRTGSNNVFGSYNTSFSPRFGLTYSPNDRTVFRLGYGVFRIYPNYGRLNGCNFWCSGFGLQPVVTSTNQGVTSAFALDQGFPVSPVSPPIFDPSLNNNGAVSYVNASANRPALMQSWTFDIQRNLPFGIMLDAAYVGSKTNGLWTGLENINQVNPKYLGLGQTLLADINSPQAAAAGVTAPYAGFAGSVAQALRPYPQYTEIDDMYQPTGYSFYNSLQLRVQKRYSNGLSFLLAYTFSKNIGAPGGDTFGDIFGGGGQIAMDTYNRKLEKSLINFDQTHTLVLSWNYDLALWPWKEVPIRNKWRRRQDYRRVAAQLHRNLSLRCPDFRKRGRQHSVVRRR